MYLLDTNVISEMRKVKSGKAQANVVHWMKQVSANWLYVSVITILELETGILRIERRDHQQGMMLRDWLNNQVLPTFANRTLVVDTAIARRCAALHVPDPRSDRDALIAATALEHDLVVVTRNVKDFVQTGADIVNPWI